MPESQDNMTISDQPAAKDSLGLTPYVIAMTEFLTHSDTKPPLTISIEGEWGSGKSSFMKQLEDQIKVKSKEVKNKKLSQLWTQLKKDYFLFSDLSDIWLFCELKFSQETQTVWFNAWRHDKSESLWATFALSFLEQISKNRDFSDFIPNLYSSLQLFIKRLDFKEKPVKSIQTLGLGVVIFGVILLIIVGFIDIVFFRVGLTGFSNRYNQVVELIAKPKTKDNNPQKDAANTENLLLNLSLLLGGAGGSLVGVNKLIAKLKELIGDPKMDLTQYLESPDYKSQVAFVEKFHEDFRKIVEAYIGVDEKVYVFIDDLDRCELDKAADLLQALNMMISNDPQIIFILGMDREKVAAAITYKQKDVLPYLASIAGTNLDATKENYAVVKQLDYGFSYLEKFVQLSFSLPKPSENTLDSFFSGLYFNDQESETSQEKRILGIPKNLIIETIDRFSSNEVVNNFLKRKIEDNLELEVDTASTVQEETTPKCPELAIFPILKKDLDNKEKEDMIKMVAPFFENNPRRLKQYINGLRLKRYMYYYAIGVNWNEKEQITQQQLAKFVAITLKYPRLLHELEKDNQLLNYLEQYALEKSNQSNGVNDSPNTEPTINNQNNINYGDAHYWVDTYPKLANLLCHGVKTDRPDYDSQDPERYSLKNEDIKKLLEVSPQLELPAKYFQLREFLEAKKWREADGETLNVMLKVANREDYGYLRIEDIDHFPCHDLHVIDQLWVKYSEGRFGFSVQKEIYQELGGTREYNEEIGKKFGDRVGWRKDEEWLIYNQLDFTTNAYKNAQSGHLPWLVRGVMGGSRVEVLVFLFSRVETCKL